MFEPYVVVKPRPFWRGSSDVAVSSLFVLSGVCVCSRFYDKALSVLSCLTIISLGEKVGYFKLTPFN